MSPRFSIIMPVYNVAPFVGDAIDSVVAQSVDDWELLIVDDASADETAAVVGARAATEPRIRILTHPGGLNCGAAASRNLAIAEAAGTWIGFLDGDDLYEPDTLATIDRIITSTPDLAVVYGATCWFWQDGSRPEYQEKLGVETEFTHPPPDLARRILLGRQGDIPCTCAVFAQTDIVRAVGGFEERFSLYEDQSLWVKLFIRYPVYVTARTLARYRQHASSTSARAVIAGEYDPRKPHAAEYAFFEWIATAVRQAGLRDTVLEQVLRDRLRPYRQPHLSKARAQLRHAVSMGEYVLRRLTR